MVFVRIAQKPSYGSGSLEARGVGDRYGFERRVRIPGMVAPRIMTIALFVIVILCLIALLYISTQWEE
ncbi:hypothetical protein AArcMg_2718 [Natrarchaeobaculum sulfurireducens]|uniref:Uncharacterized protein n=1 Tax=Natrarchaeobaculum sulfurireducens TaxID=2044521 RepID=A0A346PCT4_9EURY|nr:hypothetical protein AArc1_0988 [Natrarchaeobaculum sulfurireducens]AXR82708.1 hypothetical protein AArcMg_2718 [Natrarchaeobaculum sulfurireducens]